MENLQSYLEKSGVSAELRSVIDSVVASVPKISEVIRTADTGKAGTMNNYGEEQLALDVLSDQILQEEFKKNPLIGLIASEELPDEMKLGSGEFAVAYDPLDGSSLVDVNFSVGTIVGIYKANSFIGMKGDDQLASMIVVYGPRTTIFLTVKKGVAHFILNKNGEFILDKENLIVGEGKYFAPGNLRACSSRQDYLELLNYWCKEKYTLRYSGGMVPDVNHILLKGKGVFVYPGYAEEPNGKLRLLFECAPMSLLMEQAGGDASDGKIRILDKKIENLEQRTPIIMGSKVEVAKVMEFLR
ncbi:MAG: class 1 fructose-bisphosphatase [Patescibacteria group bacterium]